MNLAPQQNLFDDPESRDDEPSYRLAQLEVFNWGPFSGMHRVDFDESGTAIIGPTGSGKTTLVDALMTLLVMQPKYNLASTGGHESDRTLVSYVRGVLGGDGSDGRDEVARIGKTMTGICAIYHAGDRELRLATLLWTDGPSNAAADLKRRWLFSTAADQTLDQWLRMLHDDGVRELMRTGREVAGLRIMESKKQYLAHTRRFFDVGENAFTLLNRAAGLKQLNSIDEIFRELVLDDQSAFDRAIEVASEFDNLTAIHAELETARKQRDSLIPVRQEETKRQRLARKTEKLQTLRRIVPTWFAGQGIQLWKDQLQRLESETTEYKSKLQTDEQAEQDCRVLVDQLRESYLGLGGGLVAQIEETIELKRQIVTDRRKNATDYQRIIASLKAELRKQPGELKAVRREPPGARPEGSRPAVTDLNDILTAEALAENQALLCEINNQLGAQRESQHSETLEAVAETRTLKSQRAEIEETLRQVKERPGSNIPPKFHDFRAKLAEHLSLAEDDLPYLAEMLEVKSEHANWRGAIERALGSDRLRVLVPEDHMRDALRWVNHRDNRIHVRLQSAVQSRSPATFFNDSFAHKLTVREHRLRAAAENLIAARDLHCVDSAEQLQSTEHALTIEGMISGRRGRFEKQDQRRLGDDWLTGFDNKAQLNSLRDQHQAITETLRAAQTEALDRQKRLTQLDDQVRAIEQILSLDFARIDLPAAEREFDHLQQRLADLLSPDSDASKAKLKFDAENQRLETLRENVNDRRAEIKVLESRTRDCHAKLIEAEERFGSGLSDEEQTLASKQITLPDDIQAPQLDRTERQYVKLIEDQAGKHRDQVAEQEKRLVRVMEAAKRTDTGELADVGSELEDVTHYLQRLAVLEKESLPQKLNRFLDYLNRSSDQGVTQLLAGIEQQVDAIEHRIASLNQTLLKVEFRQGRFLQLQPQRLQDERKRALDTALRTLRSAALKDDQGESHFKALREMVTLLRDAADNRRQVGSRALLDPRYRLNFFVVEVDRTSGNQSPRRSGSQSGSGGEKELMASHILTASLSYALCPAEATRPLYASVVLDEAFSKSSPSAAARIIEALRIFGLHPIFVTPNKEIGLLRRHTRKAVCVQRIGRKSSVASIRWEELEAIAKQR
ncbi:MAG: ATP-binding protein [Planctomycetota bacterium]